MSSLGHRLGALWAHEKASYGLRVFIALGTAMAVCWHIGEIHSLSPAFLGIVAAGIAETDDNWLGRLKSVTVMMICFVLVTVGTVVLFPYPWVFALGLVASTFGLILLGALGQRYGQIAQASICLAIYVMVGIDQRGGLLPELGRWHDVLFFLGGAAGYGLLSVPWSAVFANRPVRERMSRLFIELGRFLRLKADLFEPVRDIDREQRRLALADQNVRVMNAMNAAKDAILSRFGRSGRPGVQSGFYFRLYYMAQDFHERASSSHYPYDALTEAFFHSDVLYRCQRLLDLQGKACIALGKVLRLRQPFEYGRDSAQALKDLRASLAYLKAQGNPDWLGLLRSLDLLVDNLGNIERRLSEAANPKANLAELDTSLQDASPHTLKEMGRKLIQQLTPKSLLFRHGVRMSAALLAGYILVHALPIDYGYWIMLTTAFVCRPHYGATRRRMVQRVIGTIFGLVIAWALLQLFPQTEAQLLIALVAGLVFFVSRVDRYTVATAGITIMVLLCFNQFGDGFLLLWPRLIDTILGCLIAAMASFFILPDWLGRRLHQVMATVVDTSAVYLEQVLARYRPGEGDETGYRIASRNMHNADAALSAALASMLHEPGHVRRNLEAGFRFLGLSNTLLGYLSALGAHRTPLPDDASDAIIEQGRTQLTRELGQIADALGRGDGVSSADDADVRLAEALEDMPPDIDDKHRFLRSQLALIARLLPDLRRGADQVRLPAIGSVQPDRPPA